MQKSDRAGTVGVRPRREFGPRANDLVAADCPVGFRRLFRCVVISARISGIAWPRTGGGTIGPRGSGAMGECRLAAGCSFLAGVLPALCRAAPDRGLRRVR